MSRVVPAILASAAIAVGCERTNVVAQEPEPSMPADDTAFHQELPSYVDFVDPEPWTHGEPVICESTPLGAVVVDGGVSFGVWAPHAERVFVAGEFNDWSPDADE